MVNWDDDSPRLAENLRSLLRTLRDQAIDRAPIEIDDAKGWHAKIMEGLVAPNSDFIGHFRGEPGLESTGVEIGDNDGTPPAQVADQLEAFETRLQDAVDFLDRRIPANTTPDADTLDAVIDVCGWAHAEWVRIHPFADGNGRTARVWANTIAMRYGLPPFVRLRPRPESDAYAAASVQAMTGTWRPTSDLFREMLDRVLSS
jgi:Fic family protein